MIQFPADTNGPCRILKSIGTALSGLLGSHEKSKNGGHKHITGNDQCKIFMFFHYLLSYAPRDKGLDALFAAFAGALTKSAEEERVHLLLSEDEEYTNTFYINPGSTEMAVHNYINCVSDGLVPHPKSVVDILMKAIARCEKFDNIRRLTLCNDNDKCVVVGDLHGQLRDLLHIIQKFGMPNEHLIYVFNGDFVDRGQHSVEVFTLMCLLLVLWPASVYINRGNHEDFMMFMRYGLKDECHRKYKHHHATIILRAFHDLCAVLSLGTQVDGHEKALIVHGGIPAGSHISKIQTIDRRKFTSLLFPPVEFGQMNCELVTDLTWSDPSCFDGISANKYRRAGKFFGPNVTTYFLRDNKLDVLIRSHEVVSEGYSYNHANQVLTVFSASNYTGEVRNKGAVAILRAHRPHELWTYTAPGCESALAEHSDVRIHSRHATKQELSEDNKAAAEILFNMIDTKKTGYIDIRELKAIMRRIFVKNMKWKRREAEDLMRICSFSQAGRIYPEDFNKALSIAMEILP